MVKKIRTHILFLLTLVSLSLTPTLRAQDEPKTTEKKMDIIPARFPKREAQYWKIETIPVPKGIVAEVTGILPMDGDQIMVSTRHGEVWTIAGASTADPKWTLFVDGLQEPLGLAQKFTDKNQSVSDGWIYITQRGELSRMRDADKNGRADRIETISDAWSISGNYHEYCFGPVFDDDGNAWVTLNRAFGSQPFGAPAWRGWALKIAPDGSITPIAAGLRSPCGIARSPSGEFFYSDNQGEWCPTNKLSVLEEGSWHGHPFGILDTFNPKSKVAYPVPTADGSPDTLGAKRPMKGEEAPADYPDGKRIIEAQKQMPTLVLPAVWFPYDKMGRSAGQFVWDTTNGKFGPFADQIIISDQYSACLMRVDLEKVGGQWQGACFPFRSGFDCGIIRLAWDKDGSLLCGETNRGWASLGEATQGLQRMRWSGETPFEILRMRARPAGFHLEFTEPVDRATAMNPDSYRMSSYTYLLHAPYGSPEVDTEKLVIRPLSVSDDGRTVELAVDGMRNGFVHELHADGIRSAKAEMLLHADAYYTLNARPVE